MNLQKLPVRRSWLAAGVALAALALPVASHAVQLTYELRAVQTGVLAGDVTSPGVTIFSPSLVQATDVGSVVVLQLYAIINNGNGNSADDGFQNVQGSFVSGGALRGNLRGDANFVAGGQTLQNNVPGASAGIAQAGFSFDLDGDGDLDTGDIANHTLGTNPEPWFRAVGGAGAGGTTFGSSVLIGETLFTLTAGVQIGQSTLVNFTPRQFTTGGSLAQRKLNKFVLDGVSFSLTSDDPNIGVGAAVNITTVPEPSAIGMLMLGTLGLVGFRRSAFRRLSA